MVEVLLRSGKIMKMELRFAKIYEKIGKGIIFTNIDSSRAPNYPTAEKQVAKKTRKKKKAKQQ